MAAAVVAVMVVVTLGLGALGTRYTRTTTDLFTATRTIGPFRNATALAGEYLSAASFLGIAGLSLDWGVSALWYPIGFLSGFVVILALVAAPLRRFGAYNLVDFAAGRYGGTAMPRAVAAAIVVVAWMSLLPQMKGAALMFQALFSTTYGTGVLAGAALVTLAVVTGSQRGLTSVQSFHYWAKLAAIAIPLVAVVAATREAGPIVPWPDGDLRGSLTPPGSLGTVAVVSILLATGLGAVGLPNVVTRFHRARDARAARRTAAIVVLLLGVFYAFPWGYPSLLGGSLPAGTDPDMALLVLPSRLDGLTEAVILGVAGAGALAAFFSAAVGLLLVMTSVVDHHLLPAAGPADRNGRRSRAVTLAGGVAAALGGWGVADERILVMMGWALAVAAAGLSPMVLGGIWWRRASRAGATASVVAGTVLTAAATLIAATAEPGGTVGDLATHPAIVTVPVAWAVLIVGSRLRPPGGNVTKAMLSMHAPEHLRRR